MKTSSLVSSVAAVGIIGLGALGFYSQTQEQQTREELAFPARVTHELYLLKATAEYGARPDSGLEGLVDSLLEDYPESARELGREGTPYAEDVNLDSVEAGMSDIDVTAQKIYRDLLTSGQDDARAAAVGTIESLVIYDQQTRGTEVKVPSWLEEEQEPAACLPSDSAGEAPESVQVLAQTGDYYLYTAQVFDARSSTDSLDEKEKKASGAALADAQETNRQLDDAIACTWQLPANSPNFGIDRSQQPSQVLEGARDALTVNAAVVLADPQVPVDSKLFKELLVESISSQKPAG
ncbi:hypothetical protein [Rothia aerolata]|uniref:Uncharacterized protein n=1 Tax=Rothia aerolata TaxID=1812262 RepID=A0A917MTV1_9MICC|nr:hypothetical protein [Rothia aerolata]GGH63491.1 hypothetical protein GCM10007359_14830 [Rothia aerolata]